MFEKRKNRHKEQNVELQATLDKYIKSFDKPFADIEALKDSAEKIIKLDDLDTRIWRTIKQIDDKVYSLARERAKHTPTSYLKKAWLVTACVPIFTAPVVIIDADWTANRSIKDKKRELKTLVDVDSFKATLTAYRERTIPALLEQTVENCDLNETSKSPHFPDALEYTPLKKKFEAAALARAALGVLAGAVTGVCFVPQTPGLIPRQ